MTKKTLSKTQVALLAYFLGPLGIHRLVMGYQNWWLQTLTLGGFFVWSFIDFVRILLGKMQMADGTNLK